MSIESVAAARAAARFSKSMEVALSGVNLSLPQYRLLAFLSGGPERATALAGWLDVSPPSLTALVDGAVARKLVERVASEEDRRCVRHEITPTGAEALAKADDAVSARLAAVTDHLSPAQAKKALEGLELLGKAMDLASAAREAAKTDASGPARETTPKNAGGGSAKGNAGGASREAKVKATSGTSSVGSRS